MRKLATCVVFLLLLAVCAPSFADNSQAIWQREAQKSARKAEKHQNKLLKRQIKQQNKVLKQQQKQARRDAKTWKHTKI